MRVIFLLFSLLMITTGAYADSWKPAEPFSVKSENEVFQLQISPNRSGPLFGKSSSGNSATAQVSKMEGDQYVPVRQIQLVNVVSPVMVFIGNSGAIVTLDDYHHTGYEHSLVVYGPEGQVLKDYSLEEILSTEEIMQHVSTSVSSRWWLQGPYVETSKSLFISNGSHSQPKFSFKDDHTFILETGWGKSILVDLKTGNLGQDRAYDKL